MSEAKAGANWTPSGYKSCRLPPSPWNIMIAGQPPAGGVPSGSKSPQASFAPSEAVIVTSWGAAAADTDPPSASAARSEASSTTRRPTTGDRVSRF